MRPQPDVPSQKAYSSVRGENLELQLPHLFFPQGSVSLLLFTYPFVNLLPKEASQREFGHNLFWSLVKQMVPGNRTVISWLTMA